MARSRPVRSGTLPTAAPDRRACVAIPIGDPGGIGPEVVVQALQQGPLPGDALPVLIGGLSACRRAGWKPDSRWVTTPPGPEPPRPPSEAISGWAIDLDPASPLPAPAAVDPANGRAALCYLDHAIRLVLDGHVDAIATGPVSKEAIHRSGTPFTGHTEYLAAAAHVRRTVMLCVAGPLRVAFVTTHVPLRKVPALITPSRIVETATITHRALHDDLGIHRPRLAVCALNPHAGEGGTLGREEQRVIAPALAELSRRGIPCDGPVPGDTVYREAAAGRWDAVIALYHDQGMIPIKSAWESGPVNITLGLPFLRTSPAHGTAFDRVGREKADPRPMRRAIEIAAVSALRRRGIRQPGLF